MKHIGCPILGDPVYGPQSAKGGATRQLLHAYRLEFNHPITGTPLKLTAPIPEDLKAWMRRLCGPALCSTTLVNS